MPNIQTVTCIRCPRGCSVAVHFDDEKIVEVRTVTTTIPVENGVIDMVSVKTSVEVPKDKVADVVKEISGLRVQAPVALGAVLLARVAGTDADIITTKSVRGTVGA